MEAEGYMVERALQAGLGGRNCLLLMQAWAWKKTTGKLEKNSNVRLALENQMTEFGARTRHSGKRAGRGYTTNMENKQEM